MAPVLDQAMKAQFPWQRRAWTARSIGLATLATAAPVSPPPAHEAAERPIQPHWAENADGLYPVLRVA